MNTKNESDMPNESEKWVQLLQAHEVLQTILDMLPVAVIIMSRDDGSLLYVNKTALKLFKCRSFEEDVKGKKSFDFMPEMQPDGNKSQELIETVRKNEEAVMEIQCVKLTGETFIARLVYCIMNYNGVESSLNVLEDMTAENEYQEMLRNTAIKEQEANQLKSRFLARMSHEIRTPMNAIIGMTELALREEKAESKNEYIHTVKQASSNLLAIINDILDFSKIEAGKLEIINEEYSVASLINDLISIIRMRIADSQVRFAVKVDSKIPKTLFGDETKIRQAVLNILNNSVKYTERGFVILSVSGEFADNGTVNLSFEVADSGIGIKQENLGKLFIDFSQLDPERNRGIEGVGLGLAITKNIITAMDGNIKVKSEYGEGSVFTITVPQKYISREGIAKIEQPDNKKVLILIYERRDVNADALSYSLNNLGIECTIVTKGTELYTELENNEYHYLFIPYVLYKKNEETILKFGSNAKVIILSVFGEVIPERGLEVLTLPVYCTQIAEIFNGEQGGSNQHYTSNVSSNVKFTAPGAAILIVDDIYTNLKVAEGLLSPYKMRIKLCNSGPAAIEAVKNEKFDLIFMDHKMPGMDGVETTKKIRDWEKSISNEQLAISSEKREGKREKGNDMDAINSKASQNLDLPLPSSLLPTPHSSLPIIALTANAVSGMQEMFIENGFNDFLSKPIEIAKLNTILEKWLPKDKIKT